MQVNIQDYSADNTLLKLTILSFFWWGNRKREISRESYLCDQILLNLLEKRDKKGGLLSILSPFSNRFNNFNNIVAQMLDSIFHMTFKLH